MTTPSVQQSTVTLREITADNYAQCMRLSVAPEQARFVADNAHSLAQSKYEPWCVPLAVYAGEEMVGFVMYILDPTFDQYGILRLMIAQAHQGKGYALQAMQLVMARIEQDRTHDRILLTVLPENVGARRLYEKLGFYATGEMWDDVMWMRYDY